MGGQRTSKEGPSCGLTKKLFLEQITAGETVSSIEKAWGMKYNTLYNWVKNWDCRGITPDKAREMLAQLGEASGYATEPDETQLLREKEVLASEQRPSTDLEQLNKAVLEIERLTLEITAKDEVKQVLQRRLDSTESEAQQWKARTADALASRDAAENELVSLVEERDDLRDEMNRMITERDELVAERDELYREKTGWIENEKMLNQIVEDLQNDIRRLREIQKQAAEPVSETQLLDRSIAELTRARKIINLLSASGE